MESRLSEKEIFEMDEISLMILLKFFMKKQPIIKIYIIENLMKAIYWTELLKHFM